VTYRKACGGFHLYDIMIGMSQDIVQPLCDKWIYHCGWTMSRYIPAKCHTSRMDLWCNLNWFWYKNFIDFFFLTLFAKKISSLTPFEIFFSKWPTFIFGFFFVFFSIPAVSNGGTERMADTCPTITGWRDWTVFFFVPAVLTGGTDFFFFLRFFLAHLYIIKIK